MALSRTRLTDNVINVALGSTVGLVTVTNNKKVFVKSIIAFNKDGTNEARAQIYYVPNGDSSSENNMIANVSLGTSETVFFEPIYPITLTTTGDSIRVGCGGTGPINILINGDKEV